MRFSCDLHELHLARGTGFSHSGPWHLSPTSRAIAKGIRRHNRAPGATCCFRFFSGFCPSVGQLNAAGEGQQWRNLTKKVKPEVLGTSPAAGKSHPLQNMGAIGKDDGFSHPIRAQARSRSKELGEPLWPMNTLRHPFQPPSGTFQDCKQLPSMTPC